jgi:hypothetical protein
MVADGTNWESLEAKVDAALSATSTLPVAGALM